VLCSAYILSGELAFHYDVALSRISAARLTKQRCSGAKFAARLMICLYRGGDAFSRKEMAAL
jgi:hypothetical protein